MCCFVEFAGFEGPILWNLPSSLLAVVKYRKGIPFWVKMQFAEGERNAVCFIFWKTNKIKLSRIAIVESCWISLGRNQAKPNGDRAVGRTVRVFANGPGDLGSIPDRVMLETQKWYLMSPCLTLSIIRNGLRVKWSNPGKGVAPSLTPQCSSYRKGSLRVTLD